MLQKIICMLLMCVASLSAATSPDSVISNILPPGDMLSSTYSVTVNGVAVPVANIRDVSYARFSFTGTANVTITVNQAVSSYKLSPVAAALNPSVSGGNISFAINRPRKMILHHVNTIGEKLCLMAEAPEESPVTSGGSGVTTLSGVDNSGSSDVSSGIQSAINALPNGGTLYVPSGVYRFTDRTMKANTTVYLAAGAMLKSMGTNNVNGQIHMTGASNATLCGRGVIDGDGYRLRAAVGGAETGRALIHNE